MKLRTLAFPALGALSIFAIGALSGYQMGSVRGRSESMETATLRAQLLRDQNTCVYLGLAARASAAGNTRKSEHLLRLHLFGAALEIQQALDSGAAGRAGFDRASEEAILKDIARIFWSDPTWIDSLDEDPVRRHLKPQLQAMFDRYKPEI
jgi:hypothetical protein